MSKEVTKHTPTPYCIGPARENDTSARLFAGSRYIGAIWNSDETPEQSIANAAHIVKCVNAHDALVSAITEAYPLVIVWASHYASEAGTTTNHPVHAEIIRKIQVALRDAGVADEGEVANVR